MGIMSESCMKDKLRRMLLGFLWVLLPLQGSLGLGQDPEARKNQMMLEGMRNSQRPMAFYGKVVDQYNNPVEGAKISLGVGAFSFNPLAWLALGEHKITVKTNKMGEFSYKRRRGWIISVENVERSGYEYDRIRAGRERSDGANYENGQIPKASNPATPAILHMRKLGEQTFLFTDDFHLVFSTRSGFEKAYDIIRNYEIKGDCLKTLKYLDQPLVPDLKVKAFWDEKEQTWTLELSAGTPGGGLLVADHKLYEAPAEGYQPSYTFKVRLPKNFHKELPMVILPGNPPKEVQLTEESPEPDNQVLHLYLRTREPWIYTRIECPFPSHSGVISQDRVVLSGGTMDSRNLAVNPYGERNLEQEQDLPGEVELMLEAQVRESFRYHPNGRPPKPDLVKLTQEWKKQQSLGEKMKGLFH